MFGGEGAEQPADPKSHAGFAWRLRYLVEKMGSVLALAEAAKVSDSSVHSWLRESEPSRANLIALADAAGVSIEWLAAGIGPIQRDREVPSGFFVIRHVGRMVPGLPPVAFSNSYPSLIFRGTFVDDLVSSFAAGDAMSPTIRDLDLLLVDVTKKEKIDGIYVAIDSKPDLIVRRLQLRPGGKYRLLCDNPAYPPTDVDDIEIAGIVVWRGGTLP